MKLILRVFFLLSISTKLFSQTPTPVSKLVYLDSIWTETTEENHKYIRIIEDYYSEKETYIYKDYYKSKALQMIGASTNKDFIREEGQFIYYYENGNKESSVFYSDGRKTGKEFNWYENGNPKSELEYFEIEENLVDFKINNYWNLQKEQKVTAGNGDYENANKKFEESGKIKNGLHDGVWKGKDLEYKYSFTENYENGKLISGISIDSLNIEHPYSIIFQAPVPKKGMKSFYSYVARAMEIPKEANNKTFGSISLTFVVDKDGNLINPKIINGLDSRLDKKAVNTIIYAKKWNPGVKRGIPISVLYSLPITILKNAE